MEVVVLVCLVGILVAFAVPRFTRISNGARASEVAALGASLRTAAEAAHALYLASGAATTAVAMGGKVIDLKNVYPDSSPNGIRSAVFDLDGFTVKASDSSVIFSKLDAPTEAQCAVTYHAALQASDIALITDLDTRSC